MNIPDIKSIQDITEDQIVELSVLAENLSTQSEDVIQLYANSSIMSPTTQRALEAQDALPLLDDQPSDDAASASLSFGSEDDENFGLLSFPQDDSIFDGLWGRIKRLFTSLRKKVRRIFCRVVSALGRDQDLDIKQIIKDVLLALIPALAASTGLMPVALPIVVSLAAMLLKYGVSKVCPA